jgi:hypothetical protein
MKRTFLDDTKQNNLIILKQPEVYRPQVQI